MDQNTSPTLERLEDQIAWYARKSQTAHRYFKTLKLAQMITAAMLPLIAVFRVGYPSEVAAVLGVILVVLEGLQQLYQFQQNWITYRSTSENLKHEKYLYLAASGPYTQTDNPLVLLADRVESLISREHTKWVSIQEQTAKAGVASPKPAGGDQ